MVNTVQPTKYVDNLKNAWAQSQVNSWYGTVATCLLVAYLAHPGNMLHFILMLFGIGLVLLVRAVALKEGAASALNSLETEVEISEKSH
jgi:hypothetical protein